MGKVAMTAIGTAAVIAAAAAAYWIGAQVGADQVADAPREAAPSSFDAPARFETASSGAASSPQTPNAPLSEAEAAQLLMALAGPPTAPPVGAAPKTEQAAPARHVVRFAPNGPELEIIGWPALPGWKEDDHLVALRAFRANCRRLSRLRDGALIGGLGQPLPHLQDACARAADVLDTEARAYFERVFVATRHLPRFAARITAYHHPEIQASLAQTERFRHPIYRSPRDLAQENGRWGRRGSAGETAHFSRAEIYGGALAGRGLEIAYVADPVDQLRLQAEGSGRLRLRDGGVLLLRYAGVNGRPESAVAPPLARAGVIDAPTLDALSAYVAAAPQDGLARLAKNEAYAFFEVAGADVKPSGALGAPLTPGRSVAADRRFTPLGAPVWVSFVAKGRSFRQLTIAMDLNADVRGPNRVHLYAGAGIQAAAFAEGLRALGEAHMLLPKSMIEATTTVQ